MFYEISFKSLKSYYIFLLFYDGDDCAVCVVIIAGVFFNFFWLSSWLSWLPSWLSWLSFWLSWLSFKKWLSVWLSWLSFIKNGCLLWLSFGCLFIFMAVLAVLWLSFMAVAGFLSIKNN